MLMTLYNQVFKSFSSRVSDRKSYESGKVCVILICYNHVWVVLHHVIVIL